MTTPPSLSSLVATSAASGNRQALFDVLDQALAQAPSANRQRCLNDLLLSVVACPVPRRLFGKPATVLAARSLLMLGADPNTTDAQGNTVAMRTFGPNIPPAGLSYPTRAMLRLLDEFRVSFLPSNRGITVLALAQLAADRGDRSLLRFVDRLVSYQDGRRPPRLVPRPPPGSQPVMSDPPRPPALPPKPR